MTHLADLKSGCQLPRIGAVTYAVGEKYRQLAEICIASLRLVGFPGPVEMLTLREERVHTCTLKPHMILSVIEKYDFLLCVDADVVFRSSVESLFTRQDKMGFSRGRQVPGANTGVCVVPCRLDEQIHRWADESKRYGNGPCFDQGGLTDWSVVRNLK